MAGFTFRLPSCRGANHLQGSMFLHAEVRIRTFAFALVCNRDVLKSLRQGGIVEVPTLVSFVVFGRAERLASCLAPRGRVFVSAVLTWCRASECRTFMSSPALASCLGGTLCPILMSCVCVGVVTCLHVLSCRGPMVQWGLMFWFRVSCLWVYSAGIVTRV